MARFTKLIFVIISCFSLYIFSQSFVVKKTKKVSPAIVKQDIAQLLGELLTISAAQIKNIAQMQEVVIEKTHQLLEQDQDSFFAKADPTQLLNCYNQMNEIKNKMQARYSQQTDCFERLYLSFCLPSVVKKAV